MYVNVVKLSNLSIVGIRKIQSAALGIDLTVLSQERLVKIYTERPCRKVCDVQCDYEDPQLRLWVQTRLMTTILKSHRRL